jgi:hypothetical protein
MLSDDDVFRRKLLGEVGALSLDVEAHSSTSKTWRASEFEPRQLLDFVRTIRGDQSCDLFICRNLSKERGLALGPTIVDEIMGVFVPLSSIYEVFLGLA